jgi:hypothetical protein
MKAFASILLAIMIVPVVVIGFLWLDSTLTSRRDARCQQAFGEDWKSYRGRGADCVNSNGDGKYLLGRR